jgi:hypothetical protein
VGARESAQRAEKHALEQQRRRDGECGRDGRVQGGGGQPATAARGGAPRRGARRGGAAGGGAAGHETAHDHEM